jgi:hypothetical protein
MGRAIFKSQIKGGLFRMKYSLALIALTLTTSLNAETLSFPGFGIEVPDDWEHSIESGPGGDWGNTISLRHPQGAGILKLRSYHAPAAVSEGILRNMTNLDSVIPLSWQDWGDYSGYQYSYAESGAYYRQWWLTNGRTIVFSTYQCEAASKDSEVDAIDAIIRSLTVSGQTR